mmetsp:Transcript_48338/g.114612  ORF Transcript_48338/g.114612 Transcript_48338/m.114612 type:complete len:467 (-) Transcript_48338:117-1517(-)
MSLVSRFALVFIAVVFCVSQLYRQFWFGAFNTWLITRRPRTPPTLSGIQPNQAESLSQLDPALAWGVSSDRLTFRGALSRTEEHGREIQALSSQGIPEQNSGTTHQTKNASTLLPESATRKHVNSTSHSRIHVVYSVTPQLLHAALTSMDSVILHGYEPRTRLNLYLLMFDVGSFDEMQTAHTVFGTQPVVWQVHGEGLLRKSASVRLPCGPTVRLLVLSWSGGRVKSSKIAAAGSLGLSNTEVYVRSYLHELLSVFGVHYAVWLDADVIVQTDLQLLLDQAVSEPSGGRCSGRPPAVAMAYRKNSMGSFYLSTVARMRNSTVGCLAPYVSKLNAFKQLTCFNNGVVVFNLAVWKELRLVERIEQWVNAHKQCPMYKGGIQSPFHLALYEADAENYSSQRCTIATVDKEWNIDGLGYAHISAARLAQGKILHWTGKRKPWQPDGMYKSFWIPHKGPSSFCGLEWDA